jgi:hypothetical protein
MRRVRDHFQNLNLPGVVNAMERNKDIQGGQLYLFEVSADLGTTIDVLQENERLGDVMDRIVLGIMRTGWGVSYRRWDSTVGPQSIQSVYNHGGC